VSTTPGRSQALRELTNQIIQFPCHHPLRVAIDGIDAAGKTFLADELEGSVHERGRPVIRASIDGFHRPKAERYRLGPNSPEGYYFDSYDYPSFKSSVLLPLGANGNRRYCRATFNHLHDTVVNEPWETAQEDSILLVDGIFLLRPELNQEWDFRIFVKISYETSVERGCRRDLLRSGTAGDEAYQALRQRYLQRYIPGQRIYLQSVRPEWLANVVWINDDVCNPELQRNSEIWPITPHCS
jgi:uridine kinase